MFECYIIGERTTLFLVKSDSKLGIPELSKERERVKCCCPDDQSIHKKTERKETFLY